MKHISLYTIGILLGIQSCTLEGVNNEHSSDSDSSSTTLDTAGVLQEENPLDETAILPDTLNGNENEMVWQNEEGLRVEWWEKGTKKININDVVLVNYEARVAGGEVYDSNDDYGQPVPIKSNIGMLIPGWEAGLLQMFEGDHGRIMIPNKLAYGEDGYGKFVPPHADIVVDIEIIKIIEPVELDEGVKVYVWKKSDSEILAKKGERITFDYFAYTTGKKAKMYDNSYKNGEPFTMIFENDNVVEGLHQGMQVLHPGDNAFIEIPSNLGYGKTGLQDLVPKNTDIVYDVRILEIKKL